MTLKKWKELNSGEETMSEDYYVSDFETVSLPKELYDKLSKIAEERFGYTGRGIVSDLIGGLVNVGLEEEKIKRRKKMTNWEYVQVDIPKGLYDRIARFADVERVIVQDMTEWVEIMEDEERRVEIETSKVKFQISKKGECYFEVTALKEEDQNNDFIGVFESICTEEALLRVAKDGYGIESDEIEFVKGASNG